VLTLRHPEREFVVADDRTQQAPAS
jgi:hypothetical protein